MIRLNKDHLTNSVIKMIGGNVLITLVKLVSPDDNECVCVCISHQRSVLTAERVPAEKYQIVREQMCVHACVRAYTGI